MMSTKTLDSWTFRGLAECGCEWSDELELGHTRVSVVQLPTGVERLLTRVELHQVRRHLLVGERMAALGVVEGAMSFELAAALHIGWAKHRTLVLPEGHVAVMIAEPLADEVACGLLELGWTAAWHLSRLEPDLERRRDGWYRVGRRWVDELGVVHWEDDLNEKLTVLAESQTDAGRRAA